MENIRPTRLEIDTHAFRHNMIMIQKYVGDNVNIMPILKANSYGTQLNLNLDVIQQFDMIGVALVSEGIELRKLGYTKEIFVLNQPFAAEIDHIIEHKLTIGMSSDSFVELLGNSEEPIAVHIEIGTGMGRTGIHPNRVSEYIQKIKQYPNIEVEGIYTHLSSADIDKEYTMKQLQSFDYAVETAKKLLPNLTYIHAAASNGIINFKNSHYNLVRPGIIIYGYPSSDNCYDVLDLKPVAKLKSKITLLKTVAENTSIGYARSFVTKRETKIATIPIGYADGLPRSLSNKGYVLIQGQKAPIIGSVCMDGFMADVTDIPTAKVGDDVYIWDNDMITLEEVSDLAGTINYEILSRISYRVPRVFN